MDPIAIFLTQLVMSLVVWTLVARYLLAYQIEQLGATTALSILLIPHMLRHLGLTFLAPGVVGSAMPEFFSTTAGIKAIHRLIKTCSSTSLFIGRENLNSSLAAGAFLLLTGMSISCSG